MALLALCAMRAHAQVPASSSSSQPTVSERVRLAYLWADFAELERLYAIYGKPGLRSELTGVPRVEHFWMGIHKVSSANLQVDDGYFLQLDALTRKWAKDHPESVLAQLLHADALSTHAWVHRGSGFAKTVSAESWAEFQRYLGLAEAHLRRTEALSAGSSSWHAQMFKVGLGLGWDKQQLWRVFEDGITKNPDHDQLYFSMQAALLPKWGGDIALIERFIAHVDKSTREQRGLEMYARLYAALSYTEVEQTLFTSTRASWASMKAGFEDRLRRHPHTDHRNMYAYFACMAKDRVALQEQLELIGENFERDYWGTNAERNIQTCKALAQRQ